MPPIIVLALGALAAGAIVHRVVKELRRINAELDRGKRGALLNRSAERYRRPYDATRAAAGHRDEVIE